MIATMIFVTQEAKAFEAGDLQGKSVLSLLRTNDQNAANRVDLIIPHAEYQRLIYQAEYAFDFNDSQDAQKYQQKTLVGVKVIDNLSLRYQYENFDQITYTTTQKIVKNSIVSTTKTKELQYDDNRYGAGFRQFTTVYGNKIGYDAMILKEELYDYRVETNLFLENEYFDIRNQTYIDYNSFDLQKYYNRLMLNYKLNKYTAISTQVAWQTDKGFVERLGVTFTY